MFVVKFRTKIRNNLLSMIINLLLQLVLFRRVILNSLELEFVASFGEFFPVFGKCEVLLLLFSVPLRIARLPPSNDFLSVSTLLLPARWLKYKVLEISIFWDAPKFA